MFSASRLLSHRHRRDLTRTQLHHELILLGLRPCRAMVNRWETGVVEPRASELHGLAVVLRVPMDAFFERIVCDSEGPARDPASPTL